MTSKLGRREMLIIAGLMSARRGQAQTFEVASIKPGDPTARGVRIQMAPGGRFVATGLTVKLLIQQAYDVRDFQITGGPGWIASEKYDINAKGEGDDITRDKLKPMLQALLTERFKFAFHRETKELPVYALVIGKSGSKLKQAEGASGPGQGMMRMGRGQLNAKGISLDMFANSLSNQLGRTVLNKTGLTGNYDFQLEWTPDPGHGGGGPFGPGAGEPPHEGPPPSDGGGPSIFTALQEQMGLKLDSQKGPVQMIVVDAVERASEN